MRYVSFFLSLFVLGVGAYLKFIYDVPDSQESINFFTSWFLIIIGVSTILINFFWKVPRRKESGKD
jgi:hypothetical protein